MALGFQSHTFFIEQIFVKQINSWRLFCSNGQKLRRIIYVNRKNLGISLDKSIFWGIISLFIGVSPSGKALDSDSNSRWFESIYPSQKKHLHNASAFLNCFYPNEYFSACLHKLTIRYTKWGKIYEGCRF